MWRIFGNSNSFQDEGKPAFALLKVEDQYELAGQKRRSLLDIMDALPDGDFEFDPPMLDGMELKPPELKQCSCSIPT